MSGKRSAAGLSLDSDLMCGSSDGCGTYSNPGPIASGSRFSCLQVEVWALVRPPFDDPLVLMGHYS